MVTLVYDPSNNKSIVMVHLDVIVGHLTEVILIFSYVTYGCYTPFLYITNSEIAKLNVNSQRYLNAFSIF